MVRLTKIYTRTGDGGTTRLVGGQEVRKDSARVHAYGAVDELNAAVGLARVANLETTSAPALRDELEAFFQHTQNRLFDLGSDLATRLEDRWEGQPLVEQADIDALEATIDRWNAPLAPLRSFVLPGGSWLLGHLHMARTICRRAERDALALAAHEPVGEAVIPYLNRLSDALFVLARSVAHRTGTPELLWEKPEGPRPTKRRD